MDRDCNEEYFGEAVDVLRRLGLRLPPHTTPETLAEHIVICGYGRGLMAGNRNPETIPPGTDDVDPRNWRRQEEDPSLDSEPVHPEDAAHGFALSTHQADGRPDMDDNILFYEAIREQVRGSIA